MKTSRTIARAVTNNKIEGYDGAPPKLDSPAADAAKGRADALLAKHRGLKTAKK